MKKKCFFIYPFSREGMDSSSRAKQLKFLSDSLISPALSGEYEIIQCDKPVTKNIVEGIKTMLSTAELCIADTSDNNANVFYEIGYRDALGLPTILIRQEGQAAQPFDINADRYIEYSLDGLKLDDHISALKEMYAVYKKDTDRIFADRMAEDSTESVPVQDQPEPQPEPEPEPEYTDLTDPTETAADVLGSSEVSLEGKRDMMIQLTEYMNRCPEKFDYEFFVAKCYNTYYNKVKTSTEMKYFNCAVEYLRSALTLTVDYCQGYIHSSLATCYEKMYKLSAGDEAAGYLNSALESISSALKFSSCPQLHNSLNYWYALACRLAKAAGDERLSKWTEERESLS